MKMRNEKGFILLVSYLLLASLATFSLGVFSWGISYIKSSERNKKKIVAFNIAEAGFDQAYYDVKNSNIVTFPYNGTYTSMNLNQTTQDSVRGGYTTTVTDMGNNIKKIQVTGYSPALSSATEPVESRTIVGYIQNTAGGAFNYGVFAKDNVQMNGNAAIDSYNSNDGAYGGVNVGSNGDLGTDSIDEATVTMSGNVQVNGDVVTGPSSDPNTVISTSGDVSITGTKSAAYESINPQIVPADAESTNLGTLSIRGNTTYTLQAGSYVLSSLSITGNGSLRATGPVTLYVSGSVAIAGNGISTSSSKPPNMLVYVTGSSDVSLSGNGSLYAGIYAPNSDVRNTGNGELYGAVVSKTYQQSGNGNVHFDEALKEVEGGSPSTALLSWQETGLTNEG